MKVLLYNKVLFNVLKKLDFEKFDVILIDQFVEKNIYYKYVVKEKEIIKENVFFSIKGESVYLFVVVVFIIVRYVFLK